VLIGSPRRGFTLVELVLALVLLLVVTGAVYRLLLTTQRLARTQADQLSLQSNVRGAALALANELRGLAGVEAGGGAQNDILRIAPSAMTYRAMRGFGLACQPPTAAQIRISRNSFSAYRDPQPGRDSVYVFAPASGASSSWIPFAITAVSLGAPCPGTGGPGITLTLRGANSLAELPSGTPVRIYEIMEVALYQSGGQSWLGARSLSSGESIQPLFGPLSPSDGFGLAYLDAAGVPTGLGAAVKSIRITVHGVSEAAPSPGGLDQHGAGEEMTTQVVLRNAVL
jgi:prepilin-type N-terminal cleavage/methylation domain-containing protein